MDFYSFGPNMRLASLKKPLDSEIPSFEDAFDTESLKNFFKHQDTYVSSAKYHQNRGMEEENSSHAVELISPATTALSNGFLDIFSHHNEENDQDIFSRSQSGLTNPLKNFLNPRHKETHLEVTRDLSGLDLRDMGLKSDVAKKPEENQDLIAMICQQLQQYYPEGPTKSDVPNSLNPGLQGGNATGTVKMRLSSWEEDKNEPTVLRKLITKKNVFTIQKDMNPFGLAVQRKMSIQVNQTSVSQMKVKRKASAPLMMVPRLNSDMSDVGFDSVANMLNEEKPKAMAKTNKKEKEEKTKRKSSAVPLATETTEKKKEKSEKPEKQDKQEKQSKPKKVVIGNLTVGVKNVAPQQTKTTS